MEKFTTIEHNPLNRPLFDRDGYMSKWIRYECCGERDEENIKRHIDEGWVTARQSDYLNFSDCFKYDIIEYEGLVLYVKEREPRTDLVNGVLYKDMDAPGMF